VSVVYSTALSTDSHRPNPSQDKQLTKADFLAELRGKSGASGAAAAPPAAKVGVSASEQAAAPDAPAWDALQDDYASLQSGLRMKVHSISNHPIYCTHESEHVCSLPEAPMRETLRFMPACGTACAYGCARRILLRGRAVLQLVP